MAFFGKILEKLGFGGNGGGVSTVPSSTAPPERADAAPAASPSPKPVAVVDVVAQT